MMNLIQRYFSRNKIDRQKYLDHFFSLPEHQWIHDGNETSKNNFSNLLKIIPSGLMEKIFIQNPISFVRNQDLNLFSPTTLYKNTIVIFPEYQKLISLNEKAGLAYLAHELALILLEIEGKAYDPLTSEIEADKFVSDLGLTFELESFLLLLDESVEKRMRLTYLTINHFNDMDEC